MKRFSLSLLSAVAAAACLVPVSSAVAADTPQPFAEIVGPVVMAKGGETATVTARYSCVEDTHLWVSVKQMNSRLRDDNLMAEGSSGYADNWLQQHPQTLICDGVRHLQKFVVDKKEITPWSPDPVGKGRLRRGQAWVQFCMTSENGFAYALRWAEVRE
jgi:hypothetical protein